MRRRARARVEREEDILSAGRVAAISGGLLALALLLYAPALEGPFFSDDVHYVTANPYVRELTWARALEVWSPRAEAVKLVGNWAPVHVLLHGLEWKAFGADVRGYHAVNILLHALNAALLLSLFVRFGVPVAAAAGGALFFLVHPANVEAVAWISQLKTLASMALALLALLAFERRPAAAAGLFALALLTKATAAFALPVVAVALWMRAGGGGQPEGPGAKTAVRGGPPGRRDWGAWAWLGLWLAIFGVFAGVELAAVRGSSLFVVPVDPDPWVRLRTSVALAMRYLAMAGTSIGVSAYHEPGPARWVLDPWWLAGLGALGAIGGRAVAALRARRVEAIGWVWAAVSFVPVSQLVPFRFPMGDRYLYSILPGLILAVLLAARPVGRRLADRGPWGPRLGAVAGVVALLLLGVRTHARAELWAEPPRLLAEGARNYPDGVAAHLFRAREAAARGVRGEAIQALGGALARGFDRLDQVLADPVLAALAGDPDFEALLDQMADRWIARLGALQAPSQSELYSLAVAYRVRGDLSAARQALERALEGGGPLDETVRAALAALP